VRRARNEAGLTQEKLAYDAKIDLTYAGGIERGKRNPSVEVLARISEALGVEPADLLKRG
jgi:transcriptional regulator with XRE-family HTH domain